MRKEMIENVLSIRMSFCLIVNEVVIRRQQSDDKSTYRF